MRLRQFMVAIATVSALAAPAVAQMNPDNHDMSRPDRLDSRDQPMRQDGGDRHDNMDRGGDHMDQGGDHMDHRRWHHHSHCRTVWHHHHRVRQCM